jgi:uncharacterized protein (TIGR04255 family)
MADPAPALPKFRKPPLSEVAVGVQFGTPHLTPVHLGLYYQRVKERFPTVQVYPPLPPAFETFGPAPMLSIPLGMMGAPSPRMWFVAGDTASLIQLQAGRLFFNWRGGADRSTYPHFDAVREGFLFALDELYALGASEGLGDVAVQQCELVYVNPLPTDDTGVPPSAPEALIRAWTADLGSEWQEPIEDLAFNARYRLNDAQGEPFGRLAVALTSGWASDGQPGFQLELTARGRPIGAGRDGINAFHDRAHKAIVRCFAAYTTPMMHERWERYQ